MVQFDQRRYNWPLKMDPFLDVPCTCEKQKCQMDFFQKIIAQSKNFSEINKWPGSNKRTGWNFFQKLINEQDLISAQARLFHKN